MANKKITQLNELSEAKSYDIFTIVDLTGTDETKKITLSNLMGSPGPIGDTTASSGIFSVFQLSKGSSVDEISNDLILQDDSDVLLTSHAIKTYVDNIATDKILEGDSSVEVIDDSTSIGRVEIVVDTTKIATLKQGIQILGIDNKTCITIDQTANSIVIPADSVEVISINEGGLSLKNGVRIDEFSSDGTFAGNSDTAVPTEKAVKTYVDNNFVFISDNTAATTLSVGDIALVDTTGGNVEITLSGDNIGKITVKKISSDSNDVIVTPSVGTIDESSSKTFNTLNESFTFVTDTNNFYII